MAFLYINNEAAESEIKKIVPLTITPKIVKYLGINLTKELKNLYSENHKTLMKEMKMTRRNGKTFHAHGLGEQY